MCLCNFDSASISPITIRFRKAFVLFFPRALMLRLHEQLTQATRATNPSYTGD